MSVEIQADQFKKHSVTKINRASWWIKYGSEAIMFPGNRLLTDYCGGCLPRSSLEVNTCKRERTKGGLGEGRSWAVIQSQQRPQSDPGGAVNVFQSFSVVLCSWLGGWTFILLCSLFIECGMPQKGNITLDEPLSSTQATPEGADSWKLSSNSPLSSWRINSSFLERGLGFLSQLPPQGWRSIRE